MTVQPHANIPRIAQLMDQKDVGCVLVLEGETLLGLITDRDIVVRCLIDTQKPVEQWLAKDLMTEVPETVKVSAGIYDCIQKLPITCKSFLKKPLNPATFGAGLAASPYLPGSRSGCGFRARTESPLSKPQNLSGKSLVSSDPRQEKISLFCKNPLQCLKKALTTTDRRIHNGKEKEY